MCSVVIVRSHRSVCRVKLASTTPTPREEIACVGCKIVAVFGESVSVSVSASWNASISGPATLIQVK